MQHNKNSQIIGFNIDFDGKSEEERRKLCIQPLLNNYQKLKLKNFKIIKNIRKGSFSNVYKIKGKNKSKMYAAKIFYLYKKDYANNYFSKVHRHLNILSQISQSYVSKSIGYTLNDFTNENNTIDTIGSLKSIFDLTRKDLNLSFWTNKRKLITVYGIASAMSILHSQGIIHRDLKPSNILLDDNLYPIICDFDLSIHLNKSTKEEKVECVGTPLYMAPEIWNGFSYTYKSDVYAFGLIMYELFVGQLPFSNLDISQICYQVSIKKETPAIDDRIPKDFEDIIKSCLEYDPDKRPTISEILHKFIEVFTNEINSDVYEPIIEHHVSGNQAEFDENSKTSCKYSLADYISILDNYKSSLEELAIKDDKTKNDGKSIFYIDCDSLCDGQGLCEKEIKKFIQDLKIKEIDLNKYEKLDKIGSGGFGNVYLIENKLTKKQYAAKELLTNKNKIIDFLHELKINSELNNELITKLIGYSLHNFDNKPSMIIITEFVVNGSLERILQNERNHIKTKFWTETMKLINIYRIASAILYLHSNGILHLDIKPSNVLIDEYLLAKMCDFNLSLKIENDQTINQEIIGTFAFIAPEIIINKNSKRTTKSDSYSFGMLLYEIIANKYPFQECTPCQIINAITKGKRPEIDYSVPEVYKKLIELCWNEDTNKRPSFEYIVNELKNNKEFITDGVDESLYHSYINMFDNEIKNKESSEQISSLFKKRNLDYIYENIEYGISESSTSESSSCKYKSSCCTSESSCCICRNDDKEKHIHNDYNLKIKELKDCYRMKYYSYSLSNQTNQIKEIYKQHHQTSSYFLHP